MTLKVGDPAPPFEGKASDGRTVRLGDFAGRTLVLFFYPKDGSPFCTRQACSLRDAATALRALNAEVLGVSTQDQHSHERFAHRHDLGFTLIADTDKSIARAYGALGARGVASMLSALAGLSDRITFIIDARGRIAHIVARPDIDEHGTEVLALLRQ